MRAKSRNSQSGRANERQAAVCRLLASLRDPVTSALGLTADQAARYPVPLALYRSAALIVVCRRPELASGDFRELAQEASHMIEPLLEGTDDVGPADVLPG